MFSQVPEALFQSFTRVVNRLAIFLPGLLALIVAVLLLSAIGAGIAWAVRRLLVRMRFDERVGERNSAGVSDWSPGHSPTLLISRVIVWSFFILGLIVGVSAYDAAYGTHDLAPFLLPYVAHSVGAVMIFIVGSLVARYVSRSVLIAGVNARLQYARALSLGVKWLVLVFTGAMVLDHLNVGGVVVELGFGILFGGMVLTLALAVGLGSRDIVARSIERNAPDRIAPVEMPSNRNPQASAEQPRSLRHF